jgi:hypothetical protein
MRKIRDSSIEEVAQDFWTKEVRKTKGTKQPKYPDDLVRSIHEAKHSYKLPRPANDDIGIWELQTKEEVLELKMRDDTLTGDWMDKRKLADPAIPLATRTKLGSLAQTAIKLNYFEDPRFTPEQVRAAEQAAAFQLPRDEDMDRLIDEWMRENNRDQPESPEPPEWTR